MGPRTGDELVSLEVHRANYFEKQSKSQAATIIDLEAKVAYLEAKVEHLEGCLERERAKNISTTTPAGTTSSSATETSVRIVPQHTVLSRDNPVRAPSSSREPVLGSKRAASAEPGPPKFEDLLPTIGDRFVHKKIKLEEEYTPHDASVSSSSSCLNDSDEPSRGAVVQNQTPIPRMVQLINLVKTPKPPRELHCEIVTRNQLNKGPMQIPSRAIYTRSRFGRNIMFLGADYHYHVPTEPGKPGVLLSLRQQPEWRDGTQTVFVSLPHAPPPRRYRYVGEYRATPAPPVSADEYSSLPIEMRENFACNILYADDLIDIQTRILPGFRRPMLSGALAKEKGISFRDLKLALAREAVEEIMTAYRQGKETISVWLLHCVGFDGALPI